MRCDMGDLARHFSRSEFACKCGCGIDTVDAELLSVLGNLRRWANDGHLRGDNRVTINSGCRCHDHNIAVGGSPNSQHLYCRAADVVVEGKSPDQVAGWLERSYPGKFGIGRYKTFTHIDTRTGGPARWDRRG